MNRVNPNHSGTSLIAFSSRILKNASTAAAGCPVMWTRSLDPSLSGRTLGVCTKTCV